MNNNQLAQRFSEGATSGKGSHMFIEGDTIYSYGYHFPVAVRTPNGFIENVDGYSISTAKHKSYVSSALSGKNIDGKPVYRGRTADLKNLSQNPTTEQLREISERTKKYLSDSADADKKYKSQRAKKKERICKKAKIRE